jgi:hypothetical protein
LCRPERWRRCEATIIDPDFLADAHKMRLMIDPLSSERFNALLDRSYAAPPETIERAKMLLAGARQK